MILSCSDVHLICINHLSSLNVCSNFLICELVFTYGYIASSCNLPAYTFVVCKIKATYLLNYLLIYLPILNFDNNNNNNILLSFQTRGFLLVGLKTK